MGAWKWAVFSVALPAILASAAGCARQPKLASEEDGTQPPPLRAAPMAAAGDIWERTEARATMPVDVTKPGGTIDFGYCRLVNNVWGAPPEESLSTGVYVADNGSFGWHWDRPAPKVKDGKTRVLPIYPSVRIGGSPWEASSTAFRPFRVSDMKALTFDVTYLYPQVPEGNHNLAYDIFLVDSEQPGPTPPIKAEVMIWVLGAAMQPADRLRGEFTDGHNAYALYAWTMANGRDYYAFVLKPAGTFRGRHIVDAMRLISYIPLNPGWWVHGIELGSEVWHGTGRIEISQLIINVNGTTY